MAMANAPQNVTRQAPVHRLAPPALAASTPNRAKKAKDVAEIHAIRLSKVDLPQPEDFVALAS